MNLFLSTKRKNLLFCLVFSFDKTSRQFVAIRELPIKQICIQNAYDHKFSLQRLITCKNNKTLNKIFHE